MDRVTPKKTSRIRMEAALLKVRAFLYSLLHLCDLIRIRRIRSAYEGIQLKAAELIKIYRAISEFESCSLLIFGLGNDSPFWCRVNHRGRTVFLEDVKPWYDRICSGHPEIEAYEVSYPHNITLWEELLENPERLDMDLPAQVSGIQWDVILVDGPRGHKYSAEIPGRMSSIYEASRLVGKSGYVFIHDAQRTVENAYARRFLGSSHFREKVYGRALLLIYRF